jgi:hypothetical protein
MKKFIGKKVELLVDGYPVPFTCNVVGELIDSEFDALSVRGTSDKFDTHIAKNRIVSLKPLEPVTDVDDGSVLLLFCDNPTIGCPGVQLVKCAKGFSQSDLNTFMKPCPLKRGTCRCGSKGDIRSVGVEYLKLILDGTVLGDYPEKQGEENGK